jgi:hypothetical protein
MSDDIDALLAGKSLVPPSDFVVRVTAVARATPQMSPQSPTLRPWQWASLGAGASIGALLLCEFVFVAFVAVGAQ